MHPYAVRNYVSECVREMEARSSLGNKGGEILTMMVIGWKEEVRITLPTSTSFTMQKLIH